uniref:Uncharacterized protein n=1 Tax=Ascaris lumbricoides TaxID=6252 RepID=A0A0M3IKU0_ASCLU
MPCNLWPNQEKFRGIFVFESFFSKLFKILNSFLSRNLFVGHRNEIISAHLLVSAPHLPEALKLTRFSSLPFNWKRAISRAWFELQWCVSCDFADVVVLLRSPLKTLILRKFSTTQILKLRPLSQANFSTPETSCDLLSSGA